MATSRIGVWLIGAKGGVASTAQVGLAGLKLGTVPGAGLVSELPQFAALELADWKNLVVGGHEIRQAGLVEESRKMWSQSRAIPPELLEQVKPELEANDRRIRPGTVLNVGPTITGLASDDLKKLNESPRQAIERIQADLKAFATAEKLDHTIVVSVASTEPAVDPASLPARWSELNQLLDKPSECPLPASSLYAIAALDLGCSYINFTPSLGASLPALDELARERGTRHMGYDGKTGETMLKSVLAPMFAQRNLHVMSWVGHNIFGNMDGKVLDDPVNKAAKVTSKDKLLRDILKYPPQTLVTIEYIESMGDWKTAWDHVHFRGFLGTPMTFQFIWQGCDSLLAAPLVLDLVRFTERAWRAGETGTLNWLSSFFKSPLGVEDHSFAPQYQQLEAWAERIARGTTKR
jgi:myo-inositol-1-phosphate synthase